MFLHRYKEQTDVEAVGLISASLAYGHIKMIQRNIQRILDLMGPHPAEYVRRFEAGSCARDFSGFSHRFNRGNDIVLLLHYMRQMLQKAGSIGEFFRLKGFE